MGVVEAKKLTLGPQNVLTQAERYGRGLRQTGSNYDGCRCPFLYSTNGEIIWFHDVRHPLNRSRIVSGFLSPSGLTELITRDFDAAYARLLGMSNDQPMLRPYQRKANAAVEQAIAERRRNLLVAMATGTGKTYTFVNQIYRLLTAGAARRVLFLVDRRALAAQAVRAFSAFEAEPGRKFDQIYEVYSSRFQMGDFAEEEKFDPKVMPTKYLTDPQPGHTFEVAMDVSQPRVPVLMGVGLSRRILRIVLMPVMLIVDVGMAVLQRLVFVTVLVSLAQVQPETQRHQGGRRQKERSHRLVVEQETERGPDERRQGEVGARPSGS